MIFERVERMRIERVNDRRVRCEIENEGVRGDRLDLRRWKGRGKEEKVREFRMRSRRLDRLEKGF